MRRLSQDAHAPELGASDATLAVTEQLARVAEALNLPLQMQHEDG